MPMKINISQKAYPIAQKVSEKGSFKMVTTCRAIFSSNVDTKVNLLLNGDTKNALLEMEPKIYQSANNIRESIMRAIRQFREKYSLSYDDITAFIMGGRDCKHVHQGNSLANCIADTLEDSNIPFTMLCGKRPAVGLDNIYSVSKNTTLWNDSFSRVNIKASEAEAINDLKHMYEIVEISDEVPLSFEVPRWIND